MLCSPRLCPSLVLMGREAWLQSSILGAALLFPHHEFMLGIWPCFPCRLQFQASAWVYFRFRKSPMKVGDSCATWHSCSCTVLVEQTFESSLTTQPIASLHLLAFSSSLWYCPCLSVCSFALPCSMSYLIQMSLPPQSILDHTEFFSHFWWSSLEWHTLLESGLGSFAMGKLLNLFSLRFLVCKMGIGYLSKWDLIWHHFNLKVFFLLFLEKESWSHDSEDIYRKRQ